MCGCLSHIPYWGPGPQPGYVPWLGIKPGNLWFTGWHSMHWATPARALFDVFWCYILRWWTFKDTVFSWWIEPFIQYVLTLTFLFFLVNFYIFSVWYILSHYFISHFMSGSIVFKYMPILYFSSHSFLLPYFFLFFIFLLEPFLWFLFIYLFLHLICLFILNF